MKKPIVFAVILMMSCPVPSMADGDPKGGAVDAASTTVKSSKSNTSDRVKAGSADAATSVKSGKSNSSDRVGDGSGDSRTTVKGSKSNSSE